MTGYKAVALLVVLALVLFLSSCANLPNELESRISIGHKFDGDTGLTGDNPLAGIGFYWRENDWECGIEHRSHYFSGWPVHPDDNETDLDYAICSWIIK